MSFTRDIKKMLFWINGVWMDDQRQMNERQQQQHQQWRWKIIKTVQWTIFEVYTIDDRFMYGWVHTHYMRLPFGILCKQHAIVSCRICYCCRKLLKLFFVSFTGQKASHMVKGLESRGRGENGNSDRKPLIITEAFYPWLNWSENLFVHIGAKQSTKNLKWEWVANFWKH